MKNYGTRYEVYNGTAKMTRAGLLKKDFAIKNNKLMSMKEMTRDKKNVSKMATMRSLKVTPKRTTGSCLTCKPFSKKNSLTIKGGKAEDSKLKAILKKSNYNLSDGEIKQLKSLYGNGIISELLGSIGLGYSKGGDFSGFLDGLQKVITTGLTLAPLIARVI